MTSPRTNRVRRWSLSSMKELFLLMLRIASVLFLSLRFFLVNAAMSSPRSLIPARISSASQKGWGSCCSGRLDGGTGGSSSTSSNPRLCEALPCNLWCRAAFNLFCEELLASDSPFRDLRLLAAFTSASRGLDAVMSASSLVGWRVVFVSSEANPLDPSLASSRDLGRSGIISNVSCSSAALRSLTSSLLGNRRRSNRAGSSS
mmetsp:Transcript_11515/g.22630  ORF Transcript_11515/g.22630 Transcript_11515/m.22630 type:complete len:203 (-) Transcript_11515:969-1577(-)